MTLIDFLLARIAEDESDAKDGIYVADGDLGDKRRRNRILGDALVKREIVAMHTPDHECVMPDSPGARLACPTLLAFALPYMAHPDYRAEWKP